MHAWREINSTIEGSEEKTGRRRKGLKKDGPRKRVKDPACHTMVLKKAPIYAI